MPHLLTTWANMAFTMFAIDANLHLPHIATPAKHEQIQFSCSGTYNLSHVYVCPCLDQNIDHHFAPRCFGCHVEGSFPRLVIDCWLTFRGNSTNAPLILYTFLGFLITTLQVIFLGKNTIEDFFWKSASPHVILVDKTELKAILVSCVCVLPYRK